MRRTNYCPDCGAEKPEGDQLSACVAALRECLMEHRNKQQRMANGLTTYVRQHPDWQVEKWRAEKWRNSAEREKRMADAIESAVSLIE
jgi:hypothetical protein